MAWAASRRAYYGVAEEEGLVRITAKQMSGDRFVGGVGDEGSCTINMYLGEKTDEQRCGNVRNF
jgi:hypothetical protein